MPTDFMTDTAWGKLEELDRTDKWRFWGWLMLFSLVNAVLCAFGVWKLAELLGAA